MHQTILIQVISGDSADTVAVSADLIFTTPPPVPTTAPTPAPPPYWGGGGGGDSGDSGGGGGGVSSGGRGPGSTTITSLISGVLQQLGPPEPQQKPVPEQPVCQNEISQNYTAGFAGMLYNADDNNTLDLDINKAQALGAAVTIDPDHIDVYQHESTGVLFRFWLDTSDIRNTARIVKRVDSAELRTDPLVANFTPGTFSVSLHAIPTRILTPSILKITVSGCISPEITEKIRNVSAQNNLELENVSYTMHVERINLPETGAADVTMTLPVSWVDQQGGTDSIHVARISNEAGTTELLNTVFVGQDPRGTMSFRGDSPHGTSLFALFSASPIGLQKQAHFPEDLGINPLLLVVILIIIATVLAVIAFCFYERRKKKA